jgi:hypothetical protein
VTEVHVNGRASIGLAMSGSTESTGRETSARVVDDTPEYSEWLESAYTSCFDRSDKDSPLRGSSRADFRQSVRMQEADLRINSNRMSQMQTVRTNRARIESTPELPHSAYDDTPVPALTATKVDVWQEPARSFAQPSSRRSSISEYSVESDKHVPFPPDVAQREQRSGRASAYMIHSSCSLVAEGGGYVMTAVESNRSSIYSDHDDGRLDDVQQGLSIGAEALLQRFRGEDRIIPPRDIQESPHSGIVSRLGHQSVDEQGCDGCDKGVCSNSLLSKPLLSYCTHRSIIHLLLLRNPTRR